MTNPRVRTDYGLVRVKIIKKEPQDAKVELLEDCEPIGEKGTQSWVPYSVLIEE